MRAGAGTTTSLSTSNPHPITLVEYSPTGQVLTQIPLPQVTNVTATRCAVRVTAATDVALENFMQLSYDGSSIVFPCNDVSLTNSYPNGVTARVVGLLRADGYVDTLTRVTSLFTGSGTSSQNFYRTVASNNGRDYWATGQTNTASAVGLQYMPYGNTTSRNVMPSQAINQRYVTVGPSWPGSGFSASTPMLYLSLANPLALRGIHYAIGGSTLPTNNFTTAMLPGFARYNTVATTAAFNSFCFEPDGRTIWTADAVAFPTSNIVSYTWNDGTSQFDRAVQMAVDAVTQVQAIHGRYEAGVWTLYSVQAARLYRIVPSTGTVAVIATNPTNTYCEWCCAML